MREIGLLILTLLALTSGGCSVYLFWGAFSERSDNALVVILFASAILIFCVSCIRSIIAQIRSSETPKKPRR